jgi:hypothetical protein
MHGGFTMSNVTAELLLQAVAWGSDTIGSLSLSQKTCNRRPFLSRNRHILSETVAAARIETAVRYHCQTSRHQGEIV